ncbi:MAG: hypothetical protein J6R84_04410, partial [Alistipes sp.]|nr:hypothetical protein [Alistipes sp.]
RSLFRWQPNGQRKMNYLSLNQHFSTRNRIKNSHENRKKLFENFSVFFTKLLKNFSKILQKRNKNHPFTLHYIYDPREGFVSVFK